MTPHEKKILEHLDGFPMRMEEQKKRFDKIDRDIAEVKHIAEHQDPSAKTIIMFNELKEMFEKHIKFSDSLLKEHKDWKIQVDNLMQTVESKLLPAYEKEMRDELAVNWIKERLSSWSFWLKIVAPFFAAIYGIVYFIRHFPLKD